MTRTGVAYSGFVVVSTNCIDILYRHETHANEIDTHAYSLNRSVPAFCHQETCNFIVDYVFFIKTVLSLTFMSCSRKVTRSYIS